MASPQTEDGFTRIANEILEAIYQTNLSACELRLLLALFRRTYGFNKKSDAISITQWECMLHLPRQTICRVLKQLEGRKIIIVNREHYITVYEFQKDYEHWIEPQTSHAQVTTADVTSHAQVTETSHAQVTHKRHERHDSTDDAIASSVSPAHKPKKTKLPKPTCPKEWMDALYDLCRVDVALASPGMRKRVSDCGLALIKAGKSPPEVATFKDRWYRLDWRGTDNQPPTPEQVRDQWQTVINLTRSNGHDQRRNKNHGLAGLRGGNSEYRVLSKEEWDAAKQAQRDGIDLGDGPTLPDLRLPQERLVEK